MQKTERELTDVEMIDALMEIVDLLVRTYDSPIRAESSRTSRAAQFGYDCMMLLMRRDIIRPGKREEQMSIDTKQKNKKE